MNTPAGVEPIAIIGLAVRVPGASNTDEFWRNLIDGRESITFFDREQQLAIGATPDELDHPSWVSAAPVVDGLEDFDAEVFGMTDREAEIADPQHRLFLETAFTALEDGGYDPARHPGAIGVYAGTGAAHYEWLNLRRNRKLWSGAAGQLTISTSNSPDYVATMLSYKLNLRGPSLTVHTACSTSLVAFHLACEALRNGECDLALAGGVCVELPHGKGYVSLEGYTSTDGHCRPFDASADGTLWGSGAGVVLLARLSDALENGDHIRAVVRGNAINNDGTSKVGFSAPSVSGQTEAIAQAIGVAGVDPRTIGYVEAHGTGTALGDPIEVAALTDVYGQGTSDRQWCAIGSVKSNIGHLSQAAGIVGVAKAVLALEHGIIPPTLNFERPNPAIDFESSPFYVAATPSTYPVVGNEPRRAGVSSFGIGGTNAHVVLEAAPEPAARSESETARPAHLLRLSAANTTALQTAASDLARHLERRPDLDLADVAYTLAQGRTQREHRAVVVATDRAGAVRGLRDRKRLLTEVVGARPPQVAFLFSGQGAQHEGMGRELYTTEPAFTTAADECAALLGTPFDDLVATGLDRTERAQPALFVVEYALARLWQSWGVEPAAMIGHSIGEWVAATVAGVFTLPDALSLVSARGRLMQSMPAGSMLAVTLDESKLADRLPDGLVVATVNAPGACVVAGETAAVERFAAAMEAEGVGTRLLRTSHAFHSPMMDPILDEFRALVAAVPRSAPRVPFLSNVTGHRITPDLATDPAYWTDQLRRPVRFADCLTSLLSEDGPWALVECGPGRQLAGLARRQVGRTGLPPLGGLPAPRSGAQPTGELAALLDAAGRLWLAGVPVDERAPGRRVPLPTYPFQRRRHWVDPDPDTGPDATVRTGVEAPAQAGTTAADPTPLAPRDWYAVPTWRQLPPDTRRASRADAGRYLVVTDGPRGAELVSALRAEGLDVTATEVSRSYDLTNSAYDHLVHAAALDGEPAGDDLARLAEAQDRGFSSALALVQAAAARGEAVHLDVLTAATEDVIPGDLLRPEHATLAGIARVVPLERPETTVRRIDVDASTPGSAIVAELLRPLSEAEPSSEIALRAGRRWTLTWAPVQVEDGEPALRPDGCYLVTGGLGGIGITVAEDLAHRAQAPTLVLLSRSGLPPRDQWDAHLERYGVADRRGRAIAAIRRMEQAGATVHAVAADVCDPDDLRRLRDELPTVHGIVHAAGVPGGGFAEIKDFDTAAAVLAPKLAGTLALKAAFGDLPLDFVVLCSSVTSVAGGVGQVDYCAANAFLDAYARSEHGWRARVVSVNWGGWTEVGMAVETGTTPHDHPVLTRLVPDAAPARATGLIGADTHWLLAEHRIGDVPVVPGTAHLECAREAATRLLPGGGEGRIVELTDVAFTEPFPVPDGRTATYTVTVSTDGAFAVLGPNERPLVSGRARWVEPTAAPLVDVAAIAARCRPVDADDGAARTSLLRFGPRWDCLAEARHGVGEDLALIEASAASTGDLDRWFLHPALLDVATSFGFTHASGSFLPLGYGRVLLRAALPERFYSHLRYGETDDDSGLLSADLTLCDTEGRVLVEIGEFTLRRVDPASVTADLDRTGSGAADGRPEAVSETDPEDRPSGTGISPAQGARALRRLLATDLGPQVAVTPVGIDAVLARIRSSAQSPDGRSPTAQEATVDGPPPPDAEAAVGSDQAPPRNELEQKLVQVWKDVLGVDHVGVDDDFFELGGNSLVAVQLIASIRKVVKVKLPMRSLFDTPTVAGLASRIEDLLAEQRHTSGSGEAKIRRLRRD